MALTPAQQKKLDELNGKMIPTGGAATSPGNEAALEQVASNVASGDITQAPTTQGQATTPNTLTDNPAFNRGTGMLGSVQPGEQTKLTADDINEAFLNIPGMPALTEFAQAVNKSVADTIDFIGPDAVNSVLAIGGSDKRVPTFSEGLESLTGGEQDFMEPGLAQDAVRKGGDYATLALGFSSLLKKLPSILPAYAETQGAKQIGVGMAGSLAKTANPAKDAVLGGLSGVGAEYGKAGGETVGPNTAAVGEFAGSMLAPAAAVAASPVVPMITNMFKNNGAGAAKILGELDRFSLKEAGKILAAQLEREGMTVEQAVQKFKSLGTDAMPAELGESFRSILRQAANEFPRIYDAANKALYNRNKDMPKRILNAFDDATETSMLDLGAETQRLDDVFKPEVKRLYDAAREKDLPLTKPILQMIEDSPTLSKAADAARNLLRDARAIGERPGTIDFINNIKIIIDDQVNKLVSQGGAEAGKIANLVKLKVAMLKQVDELLPEYKVAREEFADLAQLKSAGEVGQNIFKLSESPVDFKAVIDGMNPAQLKLAKLGVKEAIIKKFNDSQETANTIKTMFGKRGALKKAEYLWGDTKEGKAQFQKFEKAMEDEMEYAFTKNAMGNSTTAKQLYQMESGEKASRIAALEKELSDKRAWYKKVGGWMIELAKPKEEKKISEPLETAGDFLYMRGLDGEDIRKMLSTDEGIKQALLDSLTYAKIPESEYSVPAFNIGASKLVDKAKELGVGEALQNTINE